MIYDIANWIENRKSVDTFNYRSHSFLPLLQLFMKMKNIGAYFLHSEIVIIVWYIVILKNYLYFFVTLSR